MSDNLSPVIALKGSEGTVYETLGSYVGSLCNSTFLGTARGRAVLHERGTHALTPRGTVLSVFYSRGTLEVTSIWREGEENGAFLLRMAPSGISISGRELTVTFDLPDGGYVTVTFHGNEGLSKTLRGAVGDCMREKPERAAPPELKSSMMERGLGAQKASYLGSQGP